MRIKALFAAGLLVVGISLGVVGCGGSSSQTSDTGKTETSDTGKTETSDTGKTETSDTGKTETTATDDAGTDTEPMETSTADKAPALQFDSMADAFATQGTDAMSTWDESRFIYIFNYGDRIIRVTADLPKEIYDELNESNFDGQKIDELVGPLPVAGVDVFDLPSQDSLNALAGKTGQELMDAGFVMDSLSIIDNETYCMATNYPFSYLIVFDGTVSDTDTDDVAGAVKDMVAVYAVVGTLSEDAMYE